MKLAFLNDIQYYIAMAGCLGIVYLVGWVSIQVV